MVCCPLDHTTVYRRTGSFLLDHTERVDSCALVRTDSASTHFLPCERQTMEKRVPSSYAEHALGQHNRFSKAYEGNSSKD